MDRLSRQEYLVLQENLLGKTLDFVTSQVPFYKSYRGVFEKMRPFEAIKEIPPVTKDRIQESMRDFLPGNLDRIPHYPVTTGGTSGNQLVLYYDNHSQAGETAFVHRMFKRMGYNPGDRKAAFRGVSFPNLPDRVFWKENPINHEIQFSPFQMSEANLPYYTAKLAEWKPAFLHGYPSAVDTLAHHLLNGGDTRFCNHLRGILMGSEGCLPGQRERIEKAFGCKSFTWYGHTEMILLGGECEVERVYHQFPDYGYLEILRPDGTLTREAGETGELVGTGFMNRSMPFIRYRTGDMAAMCGHDCKCGRSWDRFDHVTAWREQQVVSGVSGTRFTVAALNMHGLIFDHVIRYQYYQKKPGTLEIRIMPAPSFTPSDAKEIELAYKRKVGNELDIVVRTVENIPLTARGKVQLLVLETG